jgi:hypothetical protein
MTATAPMSQRRQADQARRRQRVITAIQNATRSGDTVSVSSISRAAAVDRSFLYRHPDLLAQAHAAQTEPTAGLGAPADISTNSSVRSPALSKPTSMSPHSCRNARKNSPPHAKPTASRTTGHQPRLANAHPLPQALAFRPHRGKPRSDDQFAT